MPARAAELTAEPDFATAGYFVLDWSGLGGDQFLLEESVDPAFNNPQQQRLTNMTASTQTGLDDGAYYYRVRSANGEWSNAVKVVVEHHSLDRAFLFFTLGLGLFLVLLTTLFAGHRRSGLKQV